MHASISAAELRQTIGSETPPLVIDVREAPAFRAARDMINGAPRSRRSPQVSRRCRSGCRASSPTTTRRPHSAW